MNLQETLDAFDCSLGDAPGGHVRAYEWWIRLSGLIDQDLVTGWDAAAAHLTLKRTEWMALLRYALQAENWNLAQTVCVCGAMQESRWKPLDTVSHTG